MKKSANICYIFLTGILILSSLSLSAGNEQRVGQAGAPELLINPWARSSGWGGANTACIKGIEAFNLNVAGTAFTSKTDLIFAHTVWMQGSGVSINSFGFSQKAGETGVLSLVFMSMDFGSTEITTVDVPEGGLGEYHPAYTNIGISYAKAFSNSIYGGLVFKVINEGISDLSASGVALDAGIQYVTGIGTDKAGKKIRDNLRFGISMQNVGPTMRYRGDGMSFRGLVPPNQISMTVEQRSTEFELPSLIKIGISYEINLSQKVDTVNDKLSSDHRISTAVNFTSNSFTQDQYHAGIEYAYKEMFMVRGGYVYQTDINDKDVRMTNMSGLSAGFTIQIPLGKEKSKFALDYSFRDTNPFNGIHTIGARVIL
ncbi:MAG: PorV/PorQ family protein [Bacteroidota bacterium]